MKITNTTVIPPQPKPERTFQINLSEEELKHILIVLGSMSNTDIVELYDENWRLDDIGGATFKSDRNFDLFITMKNMVRV